jgi:predicted glycogen debranching enzyme
VNGALSASGRESLEWLEADGFGGFSSGTVAGVRTRRYHSLLLAATTPPTGRMVLVNGFDAWIDTPAGIHPISSQRYVPDVVHPDGALRIESFDRDPWPRWTFRLPDGIVVEQEIFVRDRAATLVWHLGAPRPGVRLRVRLFLSGRDYHSLHHENPGFRFDPEPGEGRWIWRPYPGVPAVVVAANARYSHEPVWYRSFLYTAERDRGLDAVEDLASPGVFDWDLSAGEAFCILAADELPTETARFSAWRDAERERRTAFRSPLERAADSYVVRRGTGKTIVAGYPWFTDWGRDTFIALRGLVIATGRLDDARQILLEWAGQVSEGMLPNRFSDHGEAAEFNSVDASLWYVVAVHDYLEAAETRRGSPSSGDRQRLESAIEAILAGYTKGTRYRIRADDNGLLAAGEPGVQLTWMDAKVGDRVVTPRIGKPVEVQALWLNALWVASRFSTKWEATFRRGRETFAGRFWNEGESCLFDVVDCDHRPGTADPSIRPNQIFAVGGLPVPLLEGDRARSVVEVVERELATPLGLRSLATGAPGYRGHYGGGVLDRDGAYHQGTVWPWLAGAFVEAWVTVRGGTAEAKREARRRFLDPLSRHLDDAGLGHVSEIADGDAPHTPGGCPFQAWSVGELLRLDLGVLR